MVRPDIATLAPESTVKIPYEPERLDVTVNAEGPGPTMFIPADKFG